MSTQRIQTSYEITIPCPCGRIRTVTVPQSAKAEWEAYYADPAHRQCHHDE